MMDRDHPNLKSTSTVESTSFFNADVDKLTFLLVWRK